MCLNCANISHRGVNVQGLYYNICILFICKAWNRKHFWAWKERHNKLLACFLCTYQISRKENTGAWAQRSAGVIWEVCLKIPCSLCNKLNCRREAAKNWLILKCKMHEKSGLQFWFSGNIYCWVRFFRILHIERFYSFPTFLPGYAYKFFFLVFLQLLDLDL